MTFLTYIEDSVDIYTLPVAQFPLWGRPGDEIVIGDLHANNIRFIYSLIRHGVIRGMTTEQYDVLVRIFMKTTVELTESDLSDLVYILESLLYNRGVIVHLLGNDLVDKAMDGFDVLTMFVIKVLQQNQVQIRISLSSRTCQIIESCELKTEFDMSSLLRSNGISISGVQEMLQNGLMTKEDIIALYNDFYKNSLRVNLRISDMSPQGEPVVYLLSYAGVDLTNIRQQTEYLMNAPLPDNPSLNELNETLDAIDKTFRAILAGNLVNQLRDPNRDNCDASLYPFEAPIKAEENEHLDLREVQKDFRIRYIHAIGDNHDQQPHVCVLTSDLGKTKHNHIGRYVVCYKTHHYLPSAFVESYEFYRGSKVRSFRQDSHITFGKTPADDTVQQNCKNGVCKEDMAGQANSGVESHKPLTRAKRGFFVFGEGSPVHRVFSNVYESPGDVSQQVIREYGAPVTLRLDLGRCSTLSLNDNSAQDSLQSTSREHKSVAVSPIKTTIASPMISFCEDDVDDNEPTCHDHVVEHNRP